MSSLFNTTICAPATPQGSGAIAIIRVSGSISIDVVNKIFIPKRGSSLADMPGYSLSFGSIFKGEELIDEVLVSLFRAPASYTGEDCVEISCHGSSYIVQEIISLLLSEGCVLASAGEFTQRAFINGKMDLAQAEAVADLISSETSSAHKVALNQMKGGFSKELAAMRDELLHIVSLMELELDFSEEDVEFADRNNLRRLLDIVIDHVNSLTSSFKLGNVIKNGVPVAIAGATNTGKSTLLNALLGEERAIVSPIHGTTRDSIEDTINIDGTLFRFIDTAGIRATKGKIESIGIERSYKKIQSAAVVILLLDGRKPDTFKHSVSTLSDRIDKESQKIVILINKCDLVSGRDLEHKTNIESILADNISSVQTIATEVGITPLSILNISAKAGIELDELRRVLVNSQHNTIINAGSVLVTNLRHFEALTNANTALVRLKEGLSSGIPTDLLSQDLREALYHLGTIVGEISTDEVLQTIFSRFCVGK